MLTLVQTCGACPEQYDAYDESGRRVGFLHLRHGDFSVQCPWVGGVVVYQADPGGSALQP